MTDEYDALEIVENTIDNEKKYQHDYVVITDKHIEALKSGKCLLYCDGEYNHYFVYAPFKDGIKTN